MRSKLRNWKIARRMSKLDADVLSADEKLAAKLRYEDGESIAAITQRMNITRRQATELLDSVLRKLDMANRSKGRQLLRRAARKVGLR